MVSTMFCKAKSAPEGRCFENGKGILNIKTALAIDVKYQVEIHRRQSYTAYLGDRIREMLVLCYIKAFWNNCLGNNCLGNNIS